MIYLHVTSTTGGSQVVDTGNFRRKTDASCTMNTTRHNSLDQGPDVFIFDSSEFETKTLLEIVIYQ